MDSGVAATFNRQLPERLHSLQRLSGLPVVFGGSTAATPAGHRLTISRLVGTLGSSLGGLEVAPGRGLGGAVLQQGTAQRVNDYAGTAKITHDYDDIVVSEERLTSVLAVPVVVGGTVHGVLYGAARDGRPIGDRAMRTAHVVAAQWQRTLEAPPLPPEVTGSPSATALDELADVIRRTDDAALRSRLLRIHSSLSGRPDASLEVRAAGLRLAPREIDALRLVDVGATNVEIAVELRLSPETVKAYLRTAMRKLGVRNRTAAVHAARASGLL